MYLLTFHKHACIVSSHQGQAAKRTEIRVIKNSKQNWSKGQTVKVGFLSLIVQAAIATPGDHAPDVYFLSNQAGTKLFQFTPYQGLESVTPEQAEERMAAFRATLERIASQEVTQALKAMQARRRFEEIFASAEGVA